MSRNLGGRGRWVLAVVALWWLAGFALAPAGAQAQEESTTTTPPQPVPTQAPLDPDDNVAGQGGSPAVFVILSAAGTTVAVLIMAAQWIRTRPR